LAELDNGLYGRVVAKIESIEIIEIVKVTSRNARTDKLNTGYPCTS